ncbi:MAG: sigma-70 family RNA polymerase sigma factor, partial [Porcipelethomonas sp.]
NMFTAYLSYPFRNVVNELTGQRTKKQKQEPLNSCESLDMPLNKDEPEKLTLADTIPDETAVNAPERVELEDDYRVLHEAVDGLKEPVNHVISEYYFQDKKTPQIAKEMGISIERVRQYKAKGLRCLRCSPLLKQLYRENMRHEQLRRLQWYQTRPDYSLYIEELEEQYAKTLQFTT